MDKVRLGQCGVLSASTVYGLVEHHNTEVVQA